VDLYVASFLLASVQNAEIFSNYLSIFGSYFIAAAKTHRKDICVYNLTLDNEGLL
jgi:hypothetical protein